MNAILSDSPKTLLKVFTLPGPNDRCTALERANPLGRREARIKFEEATHTYYIDGTTVAPRSVTGLVHGYCASHFDPQHVVKQMKRGRRWPEKREQYLKEDADESMSDGDICEMWNRNGRVASSRGTLLHYHAECLLNGVAVAAPHSPEFSQICCLDAALREMGYSPFRTEVCLFHCGLCVAGQADALYMHEATSELALLDWKRTKSIREDNPWRLLKEPIGLPDTNGWLYALQLNVYSYILSTEYGYDVSRMYLGQVHPTLSRARLIEVPKLEEHMALLIEDQISRGLAVSEAAPGPDSPFLLPTQTQNILSDSARMCMCTRACPLPANMRNVLRYAGSSHARAPLH